MRPLLFTIQVGDIWHVIARVARVDAWISQRPFVEDNRLVPSSLNQTQADDVFGARLASGLLYEPYMRCTVQKIVVPSPLNSELCVNQDRTDTPNKWTLQDGRKDMKV
jgi:hypothetical protein